MGMDFIQKAKRGFRKGWDRERTKLTLADLGFRGLPKKIRTISCKPFGSENFSEGQRYELNVEHGRIFAYLEGKTVAVCEYPPQSVLKVLIELGGKALGLFHKTREHSGLVEIEVCLGSQANEQAA